MLSSERLAEMRRMGGMSSNVNDDMEEKAKREKVRAGLEKMSRQDTARYADNLLLNQHQPFKKVSSEIEISTFDLDFLVADSLQRMYSEEDPVAEYHDWIDRETKIKADINDGDTTQMDLDAKHHFLNEFVDRETELKLCISLFSASAMNCKGEYKEKAMDKLKLLNFKLSELRRLRSDLQATRDKTTEQEKQENRMMENVQEVAKTVAEMYVLRKVGMVATGLEDGIGDSLVEFRPVSTSREEALAKIKAYRMGITLDNQGVNRLVPERKEINIDLYKNYRQNREQIQSA